MRFPLVLSLLIIIFLIICVRLILVRRKDGFKNEFSDRVLRESVIPNALPPSGAGQTGALMYTSADLESNIDDIKKKMENMNFNLPSFIRQQVEEQVAVSCSGPHRTHYGPIDS